MTMVTVVSCDCAIAMATEGEQFCGGVQAEGVVSEAGEGRECIGAHRTKQQP